ncbi:MAG TPA: 16S rRNA (cytosine(1402)-N(4))-methyltransferase RsmH [Blastocatellia bacterium]|nr:16S rRNA (cytosine(1402)-N(4))-methyltransferase RsmH [Blastocatellia bacterium]
MASSGEQTDQAHEPVLLEEVTRWLRPDGGGTFIDCTLGLGGHTRALLAASPETEVIGIDRDPEALERARALLAEFGGRFQAIQANFADLSAVLDRLGVEKAKGIVADLGVSSMQLDRGERGFSFLVDAPLDMRMEAGVGETAADLVNNLTERELADLIFEYGEERGARRIARRIVRERDQAPITTTKQLADVVVRALNVRGRWRIHPATRTFQALRIAVNDELSAVEALIPAAISRLASGGRLAIISFHSLEDRIVKRAFQRESGRCECPVEMRAGRPSYDDRGSDKDDVICDRCGARRRVEVLTRKPMRPATEEVERNPRSRSALLRVCEKL